ncbi:NACHT domain-containing protein [Actinacidiphila glaucinigra]|uniref:NACHT domain-containing protein n=1 Tax=Actinacidiphila glaucinigra TaxID=235986 RepID=UPI0038234697
MDQSDTTMTGRGGDFPAELSGAAAQSTAGQKLDDVKVWDRALSTADIAKVAQDTALTSGLPARAVWDERRLTMAGLERRVGLGHTTVSQALNGPSLPTEATLVALAGALSTEVEPLLELRRLAAPEAAVANPDAEFEERYRRYVERRHGQLSVVGLDLSRPDRACWPLDAAYLSLELASGGGDDLHGSMMSSATASVLRVERAEQALAGQRRTLVRGLAGSGKTTLLQWLAVAAARRTLPEELAHLDGTLPWVLPLRSLVRRGLPTPEYLASVGCPLHSAQPPGWIGRVLSEGRALLLVDGLDEVPQAQRGQTHEWLSEMLATYPDVAYVVTSRPSAVSEGWLANSGFTDLSVRPMNPRDVTVFVTQWHNAAAAGAESDSERRHLTVLDESVRICSVVEGGQ